MLSANDFSGLDQIGGVVGLDDQNVDCFAIGHFLENDRRGAEYEVNLASIIGTERFADLHQCRLEWSVGDNCEV